MLNNENVKDMISTQPPSGGLWDVAIIGSGPASLTAAIYTTRGAASTIIFAGESWGGQLMLTSTVDNFPGFPQGIEGPDLMINMKNQATRFGALFLEKQAESVVIDKNPFQIKTGNDIYSAKSLIIATGAVTKWLGAEGEQKLIGRGVSSCAPCDAPFFKNKKVIVVGGGDSAMEEALVLSKYASEVFVVHRRDTFKASKIMQDKVFKNEKIKVIWNSEITKLVGDQKLEKVSIKNIIKNEISDMQIDGVFVAIGHIPESQIVEGKLKLDEKGFIIPKQNSYTHIDGVFVAGDVHDHRYKQAITAAGFGCMAGMDALSYLDNLGN